MLSKLLAFAALMLSCLAAPAVAMSSGVPSTGGSDRFAQSEMDVILATQRCASNAYNALPAAAKRAQNANHAAMNTNADSVRNAFNAKNRSDFTARVPIFNNSVAALGFASCIAPAR